MSCSTKWAYSPPPQLCTKAQACHNLFDIDILVQDMTFTATKMTDTLLETAGDDKKAGLMLKSIYLDHLKATSLFKDARFFYLNKNTNVLTTVDSHNEKLDG
jgi:hypothetical protein